MKKNAFIKTLVVLLIFAIIGLCSSNYSFADDSDPNENQNIVIDPQNPTNPDNPTNTTDPTNPTNPDDPTNPTNPDDPINPQQPSVIFVDVTDADFGAVPDDNQDDSYAINSALARAIGFDGTLVVSIPDGTFNISQSIIIYSNTQLVLSDNTIILSDRFLDTYAMLCGFPDDMFDDVYGEYSRLNNITITGGIWDRNSLALDISNIFVLQHGKNITISNTVLKNCTDHVINISATKDVLIDNVTIKDQIAYTGADPAYWGNYTPGDNNRFYFEEAIHTDTANAKGERGCLPHDDTACQNILVQNCVFDNVLAGIGTHHHIDNVTVDNIIIKDCTFSNLYGAAINAYSFKDFQFLHNTFSGDATRSYSEVAINSEKSTGKVVNNIISVQGDLANNTYNKGVVYGLESDLEIYDNVINNASLYPIMLQDSSATITDNFLNGAGKDGVWAERISSITIDDNIINNFKRYGIFLKTCIGNNQIRGNTISYSGTAGGNSGIFIENSGTKNIIENNVLQGDYEHNFYLKRIIGIIRGNHFNHSKFNLIQAEECNIEIKENEFKNSIEHAINLWKGSALIEGNYFDTIGKDGIRADSTTSLVINNNTFRNISRYGVFVKPTDGAVTISGNGFFEGEAGISLENCSNTNLIEKNVITCGLWGSLIVKNSKATIFGNDITSSVDCIQGEGSPCELIIRNNNLHTSATQTFFDIRLKQYCSNCIIESNSFGPRGIRNESGINYTYENIFPDVGDTNWYSSSVVYVKARGIMNGKADGTFGRDENIARGQIVLMFYRLAGNPSVEGLENPFTDVPEGKYFTDAVKWAVANGITTGKTATTFDPYGDVTRQELAVFMARYAQNILKKDISSNYNISNIADYNDVSGWARPHLQYIMEKGVITGDMALGYARILPRNNASRAMAATMFARFCKSIAEIK